MPIFKPAKTNDYLPFSESMILTQQSNPDRVMDMISEAIFSSGNNSTHGLTTTQELQRIVGLLEYFETPGPEANRNSVFLSLFSRNMTSDRIRLLGKLISTAISAVIAPVLCSAGTWMQQLGCTSQSSLDLTENLIQDFVTYSSRVCDQLESLPMIAPRFAANFMTSVCELYLSDARGSQVANPPPPEILNVFSEWVFENTSLCLASQQPVALPAGAIAMPVTTPFAGLIRWCVLAPLYDPKENYGKLHLAILRSLQKMPPSSGPPSAINAQQLVAIVNTIQLKIVGASSDPAEMASKVELSLERFAQAVQVALTCNCIYGSTHLLFARLESLPPNPLMDIVIKSNRIK